MFFSRNNLLFLIGAGAILLLTSCTPALSGTERSAAAAKTVDWLIQRYGQSNDREISTLMSRVSGRLSAAVYRTALENDLPQSEAEKFSGYDWRIVVLDSSQPNAFSAGAGWIVVTRGLITALRSEAEFAAIIAHEMAHEILGHNDLALSRSLEVSADEESQPNGGPAPAPAYSFIPEHEIAADTLGVKILSIARYNTKSALNALTLGYRTGDRFVDRDQPDWVRYRAAHLKQMVDLAGDRQPATLTTREFNKVRWDLGGG